MTETVYRHPGHIHAVLFHEFFIMAYLFPKHILHTTGKIYGRDLLSFCHILTNESVRVKGSVLKLIFLLFILGSDCCGKGSDGSETLRMIQSMNHRPIAAHRQACNISIFRSVRYGEHPLDKCRYFLGQEVEEIISVRILAIEFILRRDHDHRHGLFFCKKFYIGVAGPVTVIVAQSVEQIQYRIRILHFVGSRSVCHAQRFRNGGAWNNHCHFHGTQ